MDRTVGIREVKARLSHYVDVARDDGPVVITERGRPVARLTAVRGEAEIESLDAILDEMAAEGMLERSRRPLSRSAPRPASVQRRLSGSAMVRKMRR